MQNFPRPIKLYTLIGLCTAMVISGCSVSGKKTVNVSNPISQIDAQVSSSDVAEIPARIAMMPLVNTTDEDVAADLLRSTLQNHFSSMNFQIMNWREVDYKIDPATVIDPAQAIAALGVDAVIVGKVTDFEMLHAGIYAEIKLGVDLEMINARGESIWQAQESVTTRAGGISTSPWGLLLNAATATLHLTEKNMLAAADELGRSLAGKIPQPSGYQGSIGPAIEQVLHDGAGKFLRYGDSLQLGLRGAPGMRASVSLDGLQTVDLPEVEPGVYVATITVSSQWNNPAAQVNGRLVDGMGNSSTWVSPAGLLHFDNLAPDAVRDLQISSSDNQATLRWVSRDSDATKFNVYLSEGATRTELGSTADVSLTLADMPMFTPLRLEVEALDKAGNASSAAVINTKLYPVAGASAMAAMPSRIDTQRAGSVLLSQANSPYVLTGHLNIDSGEQLFVEPGVEITFTQSGAINIQGDAWFWGDDKGIQLRAQSGQAPQQFLTLDSQGTVSVSGVTMHDGKIGAVVLSGSPTFKHVVFNNNQYHSVTVSGSASPSFEACEFSGSLTAGIIVSDYAKPTISDSRFENNKPFHIQSSAVYPVMAEGNSWSPAATSATVLGDVRY